MSIIPKNKNLIQHTIFDSGLVEKKYNHYSKEYKQKVDNNRIKSQYLSLVDINKNRSFALVTFTSNKKHDVDKLSHILEIRESFIKKLKNLRAGIDYIASIELTDTYDNPHLHFQLFYDDQDYDRIIKAYRKVIIAHKLKKNCCDINNKITYKELCWGLYIIKEYDNKKIDKKGEYELIKLMSARETYRKRLSKTKKFKYILMSQRKLPQKVYSTFFKKLNLNYEEVNTLYTKEVFSYSISKNNTAYSVRVGKYIIYFDKHLLEENIKSNNIKMLQLQEYFQIKESYQYKGSVHINLVYDSLLKSKTLLLDYLSILKMLSYKEIIIEILFIYFNFFRSNYQSVKKVDYCFVFN